jgi:hypothetical protein
MTVARPDVSIDPTRLVLPDLPTLRIRLTLRLLSDGVFPARKGSMLRGGFGYAFQQVACPRSCWKSEQCSGSAICPFRWVFATPHPPGNAYLHDLRDVPRPFVIEPPLDDRTRYRAGDMLEFTLVLIGRGIDFLPYFLLSFERLGDMGLGRDNVKARLERAEALAPWAPVGTLLYQDGRMREHTHLPLLHSAAVSERAAALPPDLRLTLRGPLRLKHRGSYLREIVPAALVQAACWRIDVLAAFHADGGWQAPYRPLVEQAEPDHGPGRTGALARLAPHLNPRPHTTEDVAGRDRGQRRSARCLTRTARRAVARQHRAYRQGLCLRARRV